MKRPVLIVLASLLASGSVFARGFSPEFNAKMATAVRNEQRGQDQRGNDDNHRAPQPDHDRGNDHRNDRPDNDHRGDDHRGNNFRGYDHDGRDWNRHDNDHRNDRGNDWNRHDNGNRGPDNRWDNYRSDWNRHPNYWDNRRHDRVDHAQYRFNYGVYRAPRGYYYRTWHRGDHLPYGWYGGSYVVYNWAPYRLYAPPYGYNWVRVGNDVLLTAAATGIVLDVIYDIWN